MTVLDYIVMMGILIGMVIWYMPVVLNTFGRVTGIVWMICSMFSVVLPFLLKDYQENKLKKMEVRK